MPLVVAATPIGNLGDASPRLAEALTGADVIAAEDTRRLKRLLAALGVGPAARVISYFDRNEAERTQVLLADLRAGLTVVLVTDAGMPLVSDPGYRLVAAAVAEGLAVTAIPGPSAAVMALSVSGLATDRWCFEGFLPRKPGERRARLAELAAERRTLVFFEAPHRLAATVADLVATFGPERRAAACRELTKIHEEVRRGPLADLADWASGGVRGEITLVVAGAPEAVGASYDEDELAGAVARLVETGWSRRDAVDAVATERGISRRVVYSVATRL